MFKSGPQRWANAFLMEQYKGSPVRDYGEPHFRTWHFSTIFQVSELFQVPLNENKLLSSYYVRWSTCRLGNSNRFFWNRVRTWRMLKMPQPDWLDLNYTSAAGERVNYSSSVSLSKTMEINKSSETWKTMLVHRVPFGSNIGLFRCLPYRRIFCRFFYCLCKEL